MDNDELIHKGKTLGFIGKQQRGLLNTGNGACKLARGGEVIVALGQEPA
ncbi:MAG: hypothetical protein AABY22_29250 [Nanoarchaeota archaeon]